MKAFWRNAALLAVSLLPFSSANALASVSYTHLDVYKRQVQLNVDDKGALDCILRARLEALLARASGIPALPWEDCQ